MRGRRMSLARERDALLEPDIVTTEDGIISTVHKSAMMVCVTLDVRAAFQKA